MLVRILSVLFVVAAALALPAAAHEYKLGGLEIIHPWARASAGDAKNGAAYLDVVNKGGETDRLIAASTPAADRAELHQHVSENGIMKMRPVEAIEIAPGQHIVLQPGGFHIMLMGLAAPLVEGESFPLTLTFEKAGNVEVSVTIASVATMHSDHGASDTTQ